MFLIPHVYILDYLTTQDIAELYLLSKLHLAYLKKYKAIKKSIWKGDLPDKVRAKFWIYQCPIYK